ncbi:MAG: hypothetical protein IPK64_03070 [bacterium]|nr:hypothetical protein [bacterium]
MLHDAVHRPAVGVPAVRLVIAALACLLAPALTGCGPRLVPPPPVAVPLFENVTVHFTPADSTRYDSPFASARDNGRVMTTYRELVPPRGPARVTLKLALRPIRQDIRSVVDRWDRAGSVRLLKPGMAPVELCRFMTSYGGATTHEVDVTRVAPLLQGHCVFEVFIDTWVSPAWAVDASLVFAVAADGSVARPAWAHGALLPEGNLTAAIPVAEATVTVPAGLRRLELAAISTGHCTDGSDADEFITKDNVISVDGREVLRWRPWRDDCGALRAINPYCARWSDGSWSSDYARSGWCPGDVALPKMVDLTPWLTPGTHTVSWRVEDIRPADAEGHHGYWRVSAMLAGWR